MAGHSQFKNIMYRKGAQDKKRAKEFARLTKEIMVAAKSGLPEAGQEPRPCAAPIQAARAANMPKDNIERAIKKAAGGDDDTNYDEIRYEGYGPGGVAIIVEALTDNRNRTASEVRAAFSKHGGSLGETNSVSFMFDQHRPDQLSGRTVGSRPTKCLRGGRGGRCQQRGESTEERP